MLAEIRESNATLQKTLSNPAAEIARTTPAAALASVKNLVGDPKLAKSISNLERSITRLDRHPRHRRDRPHDDHREPAPDHRQPARPDRGNEALSGERVLRAPPPSRSASHDVMQPMRYAALLSHWPCWPLPRLQLHPARRGEDTYLLDPANHRRRQTAAGTLRVGAVNIAAPFRARNFVIATPSSSTNRILSRFFVPPG